MCAGVGEDSIYSGLVSLMRPVRETVPTARVVPPIAFDFRFRRRCAMLETAIWAFFIAVPILLAIAAVFALLRSNQEFEVEEE